MNVSSPRFESPLALVRPRGFRLLQGFSPTLARPVQFIRRNTFEHWLCLEADPAVQGFCERPAEAVLNGRRVALDFWVQWADDEALVLLMRDDGDSSLPEQVLRLPLKQIPLAEHAARAVLVQNWHRILTVVNATRTSVSVRLLDDIRESVNAPTSLARIEGNFASDDLPTVRGAVFELLRTGRLRSPSLACTSLSLNTILEPSP